MHRQSVSDTEQSTIKSSDQLTSTKHNKTVSLRNSEVADFKLKVSTARKHEEAAIVVRSGKASMDGDSEIDVVSNDRQPLLETHPAPPPPPFNPMANHSGPLGTANVLGSSVVPDLMKVYESMTQSSAAPCPDEVGTTSDSQYSSRHDASEAYQYPPPDHAPQQPHQQSYYASVPQSQTYFSAPPGSFEGPEPPVVPPVPDYPPYVPSVPEYSTRRNDGTPLISSLTHGIPDVSESDEQPNIGRSLRKRSLEKESPVPEKNSSKVRKKGHNTDGRWSKRFTWPDDLHRDFVSAIFDVGLKHSSPSSILEHMPKSDQVTSERIKSHLQKYRVHRNRSKKEFMTSYDASLSKFNAGGGADKSKPLSDAEVAAHLSHSTNTTDADSDVDERKEPVVDVQKESPKPKDTSSKLILPQLSDDEKKSPLGTSLGYLMGLFFSLRQQLMAQRAAHSAAGDEGKFAGQHVGDETQLGDVFSHFSGGMPESYPQVAAPEWQPPTPRDGQVYQHEAASDSKTTISTRTNFERSMLMKQEMESQRAFQSKIRDLKQREVNKFILHELPSDAEHDGKALDDDFTPNPVGKRTDDKGQGAGEIAEGGEIAEAGDSGEKGRLRGLSVGASDDFWNTDVVDEQLFEFLMNP